MIRLLIALLILATVFVLGVVLFAAWIGDGIERLCER